MTLKRFFIAAIVFLALVPVGYLLFRDVLLKKAINSVTDKIDRRFHATLLIGSSEFEGLARVKFNDVLLIPPSGDTLLYCKKAAVSISLWRFIKGQPPFNNIVIEDGAIHLIENPDSSSNYNFIFNSQETDTTVTLSEDAVKTDFKKMVARSWRRFFAVTDFNFRISAFNISWKSPGYHEELNITELTLQNSKFLMAIGDSANGKVSSWETSGIIDPGNEIIQFTGRALNEENNEVPFFKKITETRFFMNSFTFSISLEEKSGDSLDFYMNATAVASGLNHWRISPSDVLLDSLKVSLNIVVKPDEISSSPLSVITINQIPIVSRIVYTENDSTTVGVKLEIEEMQAQQFFNSLPKGLFTELEGIKVKGLLGYKLNFFANLDNPDSLIFESALKKKDFRITAYGNENFASINQSFTYMAREKNTVVRVIQVGYENPRFVPLEFISPYLVYSVLTAEDGTFFFHRGFNEESFRQSIATNIREKRFARGGSTITMQLVKNVFLNRNKTISRKVEEALIVWLIENNHLVSKERMLEVYLNIIEWGPGIYGIGEASEFYFAKHPAQLTLEESIYLSSIIPRPKTFRYTFDKEGNLKEYLKGYFKLVAGRLLRKEIITQTMLDSLQCQVELKGPALLMVVPVDSIPADSLMNNELEDLF